MLLESIWESTTTLCMDYIHFPVYKKPSNWSSSKIFLNLGIFLVVNVSEVVSYFKGTEKTLK